MITVVIYVNKIPIFTRSARNITQPNDIDKSVYTYKCDDGSKLKHKRGDGFVPLVKMMLDTIDEKDISGV